MIKTDTLPSFLNILRFLLQAKKLVASEQKVMKRQPRAGEKIHVHKSFLSLAELLACLFQPACTNPGP
jgi:hypothetical protein